MAQRNAIIFFISCRADFQVPVRKGPDPKYRMRMHMNIFSLLYIIGKIKRP